MDHKANTQYDKWHDNLTIDLDANTVWHNYIKEQLGIYNFEGAKILEIGCGRGGFAIYFNEREILKFKKYVAADFSESAVKMARTFTSDKNKFQNLEFLQEDIQNISFPNNYFDFVFSFETIEHVPDPQLAVKELARVLKPKGILFLTTPNYFGFFGLYRMYLRLTLRKWTEAGQPINNFTMVPRTIAWLKKSKLEIVQWDSEIISFPFPGKSNVIHLNWHKPRALFKWFGLQSFFICQKKLK